jgi:hypothetical protein
MISKTKIEKIIGRKFDDDGYLFIDMEDIKTLLKSISVCCVKCKKPLEVDINGI